MHRAEDQAESSDICDPFSRSTDGPSLEELIGVFNDFRLGTFSGLADFQRSGKERYAASRDTAERLRRSEDVLAEFTGTMPERPPRRFDDSREMPWNPAFTTFWLPWARAAQFVKAMDIDLSSSDHGLSSTEGLRKICSNLLTLGVPSPPVLEYMSSRSPRIVEVGAGTGYWSLLLSDSGCDVVAVDKTPREIGMFPIVHQDAGEYIRDNQGCADRALFMCWPRVELAESQEHGDDLATSALAAFNGDVIFYVGEFWDGATYNLSKWWRSHEEDWCLECEMNIPVWPGFHDTFVCLSRKRTTELNA